MARSVMLAFLPAIAARASFINPVINQNAPDPGVLKVGDTWYMVTTSAEGTAETGAFPIRASADLVNWSVVGQVFPPHRVPKWTRSDYWAPEMHRVNGKFHVYYSARKAGFGMFGRLGIGVAVADSPTGPFADLGAPLVQGTGPWDLGGAIDAHFFADANGRLYLLWKKNQWPPFTRATLKIRELGSDGVSWAAGSEERTLLQNDLPWEGSCVEAPWMVRRGGEYFLFYSAETTWRTKYVVAVARASSIMGPYTKSGAPILSQFASDAEASIRKFATTGHASVVETDQGFVMVYHAYHADALGGDRVVLVDRIAWDPDGWPRVGTCNSPTLTSQPMPMDDSNDMPACLDQGSIYQMGWNAHTSPMTAVGNSAFYVQPGNCPGGTVSFELVDQPGHFVRLKDYGSWELGLMGVWWRKDYKLLVERDDGSLGFSLDSSFMAPPGLTSNSPATTSLRPVSHPFHFVLRHEGVLGVADYKASSQYATDATWTPIAVVATRAPVLVQGVHKSQGPPHLRLLRRTLPHHS